MTSASANGSNNSNRCSDNETEQNCEKKCRSYLKIWHCKRLESLVVFENHARKNFTIKWSCIISLSEVETRTDQSRFCSNSRTMGVSFLPTGSHQFKGKCSSDDMAARARFWALRSSDLLQFRGFSPELRSSRRCFEAYTIKQISPTCNQMLTVLLSLDLQQLLKYNLVFSCYFHCEKNFLSFISWQVSAELIYANLSLCNDQILAATSNCFQSKLFDELLCYWNWNRAELKVWIYMRLKKNLKNNCSIAILSVEGLSACLIRCTIKGLETKIKIWYSLKQRIPAKNI